MPGLVAALGEVGFGDIEVATESREFTYADAEEWWAAKWTHGARYPLERMPPDILECFRREAFSRLIPLTQPAGFQERWAVACVVATKPEGQESFLGHQ